MNKKCNPADSSQPVKPFVLKQTWIVFFVSFANFLMTLLRCNLSVAIIAIQGEKTIQENDFVNMNNETDQVELVKRYPLDDTMVAQILASYFYGYTVAQMPAGRLSEIFGARYVLFLGTLCSGFVSFCIPFLLDWSPIAMIVGRVLIGMSHATCLSCGYTFFTEWIPDAKQKSVAITWINVAFELGGICSFFFAGFICSSDLLGWRYTFYLFALPAFVWSVPYYFLVYSRPEEDPNLSEYERRMIENARKEANCASGLSANENLVRIPPKLDWKVILTSGPVIASCFTKSGVALVYYIVTVKIPAYFQDVFNMPIASNGSITALAGVAILTSKFLCLKMSTFLLNHNPMSITNFRKVFQSLATFIPGLCLFVITLRNDDQVLATCLVFVAMFGAGFVCLGDSSSTAEFAKELSGSIFGFTNIFACLSGMFAPLIVSACQSNFDDRVTAWNWTFYITVLFLLISILIFVLFASAEPQPWAVSKFVSVEEFEKKELEKNKTNQKPTKSQA